MCKLRSYRHSCGHTTHRPLSACRFTYASGERALCHAVPDLTITLPDDCRSCLYQVFCESWENRIADARSRQAEARLGLRNTLLEDDDESSWGGFNDSSEWGHSRFSDYAEAARRKRDHSDREVEQLWAQYQREQWTQWRPLVTGPNHNNESPHKQRLRRRRTSTRCSGDSPLRKVTSASEVESHSSVAEEEDNLLESGSEDCWNSLDVEYEGATLSPTESEESYQSDDIDEPSPESLSPYTPRGSHENLSVLSSWAWPPKSPTKMKDIDNPMTRLKESVRQWNPEVKVGGTGFGSIERVGVVDEEDLQLPAWGC